jgi:hypothetical protein
MKVRELIDLLSKCDPEANVLLSDYSCFNCETMKRPIGIKNVVDHIEQGFSQDPRDMSWDMSWKTTSSGYQCEPAVWIVGHSEVDV